jgi:hypothetical protein
LRPGPSCLRREPHQWRRERRGLQSPERLVQQELKSLERPVQQELKSLERPVQQERRPARWRQW